MTIICPASNYLQESRTGRNIRHHLVPLLRQSIYSRFLTINARLNSRSNPPSMVSRSMESEPEVACSTRAMEKTARSITRRKDRAVAVPG